MDRIGNEARSTPMFDIRRQVDHDGLDGRCRGVHQRDCSLKELYLLATDGLPVTLECMECGHQVGIVDVVDALERAAFALADETSRVMRLARRARIKTWSFTLSGLCEQAAEDGEVPSIESLDYGLSHCTQQQADFTKRILQIVVTSK